MQTEGETVDPQGGRDWYVKRNRYDDYLLALWAMGDAHGYTSRETRPSKCFRCRGEMPAIFEWAAGSRHCLCAECVVATDADKTMRAKVAERHEVPEDPWGKLKQQAEVMGAGMKARTKAMRLAPGWHPKKEARTTRRNRRQR